MKPPRRPFRRFAPARTGDAGPLGELESAVMAVVWSRPGEAVSVAHVHAALPPEWQGVYTTVKTTMGRLADKGILTRARQGKAYLYQAALSREELERRIVAGALDRLVEQFPGAVASFFVKPDPGVSDAQLALLEDALRRRRERDGEDSVG